MCVVHIAAQGQVREGLDYGVNCRLLIKNQRTLLFFNGCGMKFWRRVSFFLGNNGCEKKNNRMEKEEMDIKKEKNDGRKGNSR